MIKKTNIFCEIFNFSATVNAIGIIITTQAAFVIIRETNKVQKYIKNTTIRSPIGNPKLTSPYAINFIAPESYKPTATPTDPASTKYTSAKNKFNNTI